MRPSQLLAAAVALSSVAAAWPDVFENVNALGDVKNAIYGRQDNNKPESTADPTFDPKSTDAPKETDKPSSTEKATVTTKGGDTKSSSKGSGSGSGTAKATGTKSTGKPKATNFGADVPAGGIAMVTPSAIAGAQFYKIGEWITFAWNYTSLSVTPSAIDIMATCTANQQTYTIAVNQSTHETGKVLWDTKSYKEGNPTKPLLTETYTLLIYDADSSVSATARPGYLAVYNQFTFGMYDPQPYTPWADFKCANCNSAFSAFEKLTLKALLITSFTTIASLLYFAASFGVW
jgi:hypothetical protein